MIGKEKEIGIRCDRWTAALRFVTGIGHRNTCRCGTAQCTCWEKPVGRDRGSAGANAREDRWATSMIIPLQDQNGLEGKAKDLWGALNTQDSPSFELYGQGQPLHAGPKTSPG